MHERGPTQPTPLSSTDEPLGLGTSCADQPDPFQRSASGPLLPDPTPTHALDEVHDTPSSVIALLPAGAAADCIDQVKPSHLSINAAGRDPTEYSPTAMHILGAVHDTASSTTFAPVAGFGVG